MACIGDANIFPEYTFDRRGAHLDNITDWALDQFSAHYEGSALKPRPMTKDAIFHYVYGVLHDPVWGRIGTRFHYIDSRARA